MNVLFLGLGKYKSINSRGIYLDLLREFVRGGHEVYIVTALEPESKEPFSLVKEDHAQILKVKTGRITKTNPIEQGINTLLLQKRYIKAIEKHYPNVRFDLVLYPTPPITFLKVVEYIKKRDKATAYLMLKDIFPQNAVDIGMMSKSGVKGLMYRYFRNKEKKLYKVSDRIGCMSEANVAYLLKHNPEVDPKKVMVCPNSAEIVDMSVDEATRTEIRNKYGIPLDKKVFVYGGNLGKPQGIPFIVKCLEKAKDIDDAFFLIVGDGTEYAKLSAYSERAQQNNLKLMKRIPKDDYDKLAGACDVGLIFLDHRFTIPNFPSRLLSYMQAKIPVLACTDPNTDVGKVITGGGFGWWCESDDAQAFADTVKKALSELPAHDRQNEENFLIQNYTSRKTFEIIMNSLGGDKAK